MMRKHAQKGFLLAELMIVLPIATLIMIILFAALFTQYAAVLAESSQANLRANGQSLLINLQDELLFTIAFGETIDTNLVDSHAPSGGWTYNTSPQTLIINEVALDSNRQDEARRIIRRRLNDCATSAVTANPVAITDVIYFVEQDSGSNYGTLKKRTLTPDYLVCSVDLVSGDPCAPESATCRAVAKRSSCPDADVGSGNCEIADATLSENVLDFQIRYFAQDNIETSFPSAAEKIEVTLTLGDRVFGKDVTAEVTHTIRKIN